MGLLEEWVKATSRGFDSKMLHDSLVGFANAMWNPGEGVMELLERRTCDRCVSGNLNPLDVSKLLWAYARVAQTFGEKPGEPMMTLLEKRAEVISGELDSKDVSRTLQAYAMMGRMPGSG